jgi:hypothetical protein
MERNIEIAKVHYKYGFCHFPYLSVVDFNLLLKLIRSQMFLPGQTTSEEADGKRVILNMRNDEGK